MALPSHNDDGLRGIHLNERLNEERMKISIQRTSGGDTGTIYQ